MKKVFKFIAIITTILILLQSAAFLAGRHGWRLFGFNLCENPDTLYFENVYVTDDKVHIMGSTMSSASSYVGYTHKIKDDVLYIGIKENLLLGFNTRRGNYSFEIEDDFKNINAIYIVNGENEKCIWTLEKDKKYMEKIKRVRLYKSVNVEADENYKLKIMNADFSYTDENMLQRIKHPTFTDELYISKGAYLGVAELENGDEMYLAIERHYDYYNIIGKWGNYDY